MTVSIDVNTDGRILGNDDYDGANFVIRDGLIRTKVLITGRFPSKPRCSALNATTTSGTDDAIHSC